MRILKEYGVPAGALILVLSIVLGTQVAESWIPWTMRGFGALLLAAGVVLDRERIVAALRGRKARAAGASLGYILTVFAVLVLVNFLAGRHHARIDTTENQAFSLSEQTIKVLQGLPREVTITTFFRDGEPAGQKLQDLLKEYNIHSSRLVTRQIDPDRSPGDVKRYNITEYSSIVVESGKSESRTTIGDEEALTNAILKVTRDRATVVYFTTGHGEHDLTDNERDGVTLLKAEMEKQNYEVKPLVLTQGVPEDASVVVIAGPRKTLLPPEVAMIDRYLAAGGRSLVLLDPEGDAGLKDVLAAYGVAVRGDVIIDKVSQLFGNDARVPMVPAEGYDEFHPVTKTFRYQTFYPLASSIAIQESLPERVVATKLAQTSAYSWGETNREEIDSGRITLNQGIDAAGPVTVAAALTRKSATPPAGTDGDEGGEKGAGEEGTGEKAGAKSEPEARLLIFGDSDFISNAYFNAAGNGDLALSGIAWLAEQDDLVSIRPKTALPRILTLTPRETFYYFWMIVALAPVTIVVTGVALWMRRKKL